MEQSTNNDARQQDVQERRNLSARRRHAESRLLCLELCRSVLRVALVIDDRQEGLPSLKTWTVAWRHDAASLLSERGKHELTAALREIVSREKLVGSRVSVAINGTLCVNRAASGPNALVDQEIAELEERSQLYLSLGPGRKTTAVGRKQIDARHVHTLVSVANEDTLELIVGAAESAGLVVDVVESSLVSLARFHGSICSDDQAAVVAAIDEERFEVGVCRQGQLLLEYHPSSDATTARLGEVIEGHHNRMERFCRRQYGIGDTTLGRLILVGQPEATSAAQNSVVDGMDVGMLPMGACDRYWRLLDGDAPGPELAAALGIALRSRIAGGDDCPNLMEKIHANARTPIKPFLLRASLPLAATLLLALVLGMIGFEQRMEVSALSERYEAVRPVALRGEKLDQTLRNAEMEISELKRMTSRAPRERLEPLIAHIGGCMPEDVWLKHLVVEAGGEARLSGVSYSEGGVYEFARHLDRCPEFHDVALRGTGSESTPEGPATSFDIDLMQAPAAPAPEEEPDDR